MPIKKEVIKTIFTCENCSFEGTEKETENHEILKHKIKTINVYEDKILHFFNNIKEYKLYCKSISSYINLSLEKYLPGWLISWEVCGKQFTSVENFLKNIENEIKELEERLEELKTNKNKIIQCLQKN